MSYIEERLAELGVELPEVSPPPARFEHAVTVGNLLFTSGTDCKKNGRLLYEGKLGKDLTVEEGYDAAKHTVINLLAVLKNQLGDLDRVNRIVKLLIFINSAEGFNKQPLVANGASDFLEAVFGEKGKHARSAVGASELPFDIPVEIEMIVEIKT